MPTAPMVRVFTGTSDQVLNAIRNGATVDYRNFVPYAQPNAESIKAVGSVIMQHPGLQNEFINTLVNRIALTIVTSKAYDNPWKVFKKGMLELGETVQDVFVDLQDPHQFDPVYDEDRLYKRELPDVRAAYYNLNYQQYYPVTISESELRLAFVSLSGVTDLVDKIVARLYTAMEYDDYLVMKYLAARAILNGYVKQITGASMTAANAATNVAQIKAISNAMTFLSPDYNLAGVYNHAEKRDQYAILSTSADAIIDVSVLASAFHMEKAEFMGHRMMVNDWQFSAGEIARLNKLFAGDPAYVQPDSAANTILGTVVALICDENFFQVYDNLLQMRTAENGRALYWNYFLHAWRTFAISPFANAAVITTGAGSITSVTVSPETITHAAGTAGSYHLSATVVKSGVISGAVTWSKSGTDANKITLDNDGNVTVPATFVPDADSTITITATSVADSTKSDTCALTVDVSESPAT